MTKEKYLELVDRLKTIKCRVDKCSNLILNRNRRVEPSNDNPYDAFDVGVAVGMYYGAFRDRLLDILTWLLSSEGFLVFTYTMIDDEEYNKEYGKGDE